MKWDYQFIPLEEFHYDESKKIEDLDYEGHYEVNLEQVNNLGKDGWELIQVVMINGVQHGWFKIEIENE